MTGRASPLLSSQGEDPTDGGCSLSSPLSAFIGEARSRLVALLTAVPRVFFVQPNGLLVNLTGVIVQDEDLDAPVDEQETARVGGLDWGAARPPEPA